MLSCSCCSYDLAVLVAVSVLLVLVALLVLAFVLFSLVLGLDVVVGVVAPLVVGVVFLYVFPVAPAFSLDVLCGVGFDAPIVPDVLYVRVVVFVLLS